MTNENFDVIVLGGGPAGLTAGIYLSRAKIKTLILNEGMIGGQIILSHEIANYPGVENISGFMLANTMKKQAESFGCKMRGNINISKIDLTSELKSIEINEKETYTAKSIILATGGKSRPLGIKGENQFKGRGVSYCATCDGDFYQDKEIIVVGGGNSALEEAVALTKYASKVTIVHQFDHFQAFKHAIKDAEDNEKINFILESELIEIKGEGNLSSVLIQHQETKAITEFKVDGVFVFIGYTPNTEKFEGIINLTNRKEIISDEKLKTNIEGVFVAGDLREKSVRQITTAVSDGTIAATSAIEFLGI